MNESHRFADLRRLTFDSLQIALCPLIPIPLLDDWAMNFLRRRMTTRLILEESPGLELESSDLELLAYGLPDEGRGCLGGCFFFALVKPVLFVVGKVLRKIFRKFFFFLTIKDSVDRFSHTLHEAWLIRHALREGVVDQYGAKKVRGEIDTVIEETDPRPIERILSRTLKGSQRVLGKAGKKLSRTMRALRRSEPDAEDLHFEDPALSDEDQEFEHLVDEMARELDAEASYFKKLTVQLSVRLTRDVPAQSPPVP